MSESCVWSLQTERYKSLIFNLTTFIILFYWLTSQKSNNLNNPDLSFRQFEPFGPQASDTDPEWISFPILNDSNLKNSKT